MQEPDVNSRAFEARNATELVRKFAEISLAAKLQDPFAEVVVVSERREISERLMFRQDSPILNAYHRDPVDLLNELAEALDPTITPNSEGAVKQIEEGDLVDSIVDTLRDFNWGLNGESLTGATIDSRNFLNVESLQGLVQKFDWIDLRRVDLSVVSEVKNVSSISRRSLPFVLAVQDLLATRGNLVPGRMVEHLLSIEATPGNALPWTRQVVFVGWQPPERYFELLRRSGVEAHVLILSVNDQSIKGEPGIAVQCHSAPDPEAEVRYALARIGEYVDTDESPESFRSIAIAYTSESEYLPVLADELKLRDDTSIQWHGKTPDLLSATRPVRDFVELMNISTRTTEEFSRDDLLRIMQMPLRPAQELTGVVGVEYWQLRSFISREQLSGGSKRWMPILNSYIAARDDTSADDREDSGGVGFAERRASEAQALVSLMAELRESFEVSLRKTKDSSDELETFPNQIVSHLMPTIFRDSPYGGPLNRVASRAIADFAEHSKTWVNHQMTQNAEATNESRKSYARSRLGLYLEGKTVRHGKPHHGIAIGNIAILALSEWDFIAVLGASDAAMRSSAQSHPLLPEAIIRRVSESQSNGDFSNLILTSEIQRQRNASSMRSLLENADASDFKGGHRSVLASFSRESKTESKAWVGMYSGIAVLKPAGSGSITRSRWHLSTESVGQLPERSYREREAVIHAKNLISGGVGDIGAMASEFRAANAYRNPLGSEFFGNVLHSNDLLEVSNVFDKKISATYVEKYLDCPHHFFVTRVLGFKDDVAEDEVGEISAANFGILVHRVFELFVNPAELKHTPEFKGETPDLEALIPGCGESYSPAAVTHLEALTQFVANDLIARGVAGESQSFSEKINNFKRLLPDYLAVDTGLRRLSPEGADCVGQHGTSEHWHSKPVKAEYSFGEGDSNTVNIPVDHHGIRGELHFMGQIDRVDLNRDASHVSVIDYKTGQKKYFQPEIDRKIQYLLYSYAILKDPDFAGAHSAFGHYLFYSSVEKEIGFVESPAQKATREDGKLVDSEYLLTALAERLKPFVESFASGTFAPGHREIKEMGYICPSCNLLGQRVAMKANPLLAQGDETGQENLVSTLDEFGGGPDHD